jgi:hypothetical protein
MPPNDAERASATVSVTEGVPPDVVSVPLLLLLDLYLGVES